jgi:beta-phosphoglucomutase-like phosphatase (HAD superfamily)
MLRQVQPISCASSQHVIFSPANNKFLSQSQTLQAFNDLSAQGALPIKLIQSDMAGTLIQPYCMPPLAALCSIFKTHGVALSAQQLTGPMGKSKPEHISELVDEFRLDLDKEILVQEFETELNRIMGEDTTLTPHAADFINLLRKINLKLAGTTGYFEKFAVNAMQELTKLNALDAMTYADEIPHSSRLDLLLANNRKLNMPLESMHEVIFFTDTKSDILSARKADPQHMPWIIAVADYSAHNNIATKTQLQQMSAEELQARRTTTTVLLSEADPHMVIANLSEAPLALLYVCQALQRGERPANVHCQSLETSEKRLTRK